ncbi:hypothetical protein CE91St36_19880 [Christensenellaceae bacterium]|nr:hypothetical protein CE91St36_19880 [Christensenellaceae bacterium]BDF61837.1 hypothetical protein CE91St37_19870 [Christensenellaceae bacterium]
MDINGYAMKGVKTFNTPDGGGYNASIYYEGKRICEVHEAGMGAPPYVEWFISKNFDQCCATRDFHDPILNEWFIGDLYDFYEDERQFKKDIKKYPDACYVKVEVKSSLPKGYTFFKGKNYSDEALKKEIYKAIPKEQVESIRIYRTLNDFKIQYPDINMLSESVTKFYENCLSEAGIADCIKKVELSTIHESLLDPELRKGLLENIRENIELLSKTKNFRLVIKGEEAVRLFVQFERNLERGSCEHELKVQATDGIMARQDQQTRSDDEIEL